MVKMLKKLGVILLLFITLCGCGKTDSTDHASESADLMISEIGEDTSGVIDAAQKAENPSISQEETKAENPPISQEETKAENSSISQEETKKENPKRITFTDIPAYAGVAYVEINGNVPLFADSEITTVSFESYSNLDALGRCGTALSCVGKDIMPTEERGAIGQIKPSGWHLVKYDNVDGLYLYNRCHLIGYQLTGENANEKNLITGTRYLNVVGMLPFEDKVADYVKGTGYHVMYRATPMYEGNNLLAAGVLLEALSVEDSGKGISFNVFIYNVQPGITIDYATGDSYAEQHMEETTAASTVNPPIENEPDVHTYVLNKNTKKFHYSSCSDVAKMSQKNKEIYTGAREVVIQRGYTPCGHCHP